MNVGRENLGSVADCTARAMHAPAGVPPYGDPTLAFVTRPVLLNVMLI